MPLQAVLDYLGLFLFEEFHLQTRDPIFWFRFTDKARIDGDRHTCSLLQWRTEGDKVWRDASIYTLLAIIDGGSKIAKEVDHRCYYDKPCSYKADNECLLLTPHVLPCPYCKEK